MIESSSKIKENNNFTITSFTLMDFLLQTDEVSILTETLVKLKKNIYKILLK